MSVASGSPSQEATIWVPTLVPRLPSGSQHSTKGGGGMPCYLCSLWNCFLGKGGKLRGGRGGTEKASYWGRLATLKTNTVHTTGPWRAPEALFDHMCGGGEVQKLGRNSQNHLEAHSCLQALLSICHSDIHWRTHL